MSGAFDRLIQRLHDGEVNSVCVEPDGRWRSAAPKPALVLPGSFNPLHHGHRELARVAAQLTGLAPVFELSILNVDKPTLDEAEVRRRAAQFEWHAPLWVTRAPLFAQKTALFPGAVFVIGFDTARRLIDPRYTADDAEELNRQLAWMRDLGCRFLVAGRHEAAGRFAELNDLAVPSDFAELFAPIPASRFACRISSTALRSASGAA
jgi:hypothetical protein